MTYFQDVRKYLRHAGFGVVVLMCSSLTVIAPEPGAAQAPARKPATTQRRPLTPADVQKLWSGGDDMLMSNEVRLRGLAFTPSGYWLEVELPKLTSVPLSKLPSSASALRHLIPPAPDLTAVTTDAPALLASLKDAAQKRSDSDLQTLVDPSLLANKASVYDLFDSNNFRASSLGKAALDEHGDVGMPYFELTKSNVEKLYYVLFSKPKGKLIVQNIITGPTVADLYLHDEEALATSKLETMFRALDDGDQTGLKDLCTPGLYQAIQDWGGEKHPGDRLSRGHRFSQVTAQSSVPLDQKSIRVVTKVSYPLGSGGNLTFYIDFERVGNELKVVRLRDDQNKTIVYDPNIDNYLNRRYGLPDESTNNDVAMTDETSFLSSSALKAKALRVLQYHDKQQISDIAKMYVEQNPTSGDGYGLRAAADLMQRKPEDANKDGLLALDKNGTVYFLLDRHSLTSAKPFTLAVLGVSKSKIDLIPAPGSGTPETIDISSVKVSFEKGIGLGSFVKVSEARPFLKLEFKGSDGKGKTYNFADYGTMCPSDTSQPRSSDLVSEQGGTACGVTSVNGSIQQAQGLPVLTPQTWREDLTAVIQVVQAAKSSKK